MNKKRNLIFFSLCLLLFNCSFDSKTGIWSGAEDEEIRIAKLEQAQIKATNRTKVYSSQNYYFKEMPLNFGRSNFKVSFGPPTPPQI